MRQLINWTNHGKKGTPDAPPRRNTSRMVGMPDRNIPMVMTVATSENRDSRGEVSILKNANAKYKLTLRNGQFSHWHELGEVRGISVCCARSQKESSVCTAALSGCALVRVTKSARTCSRDRDVRDVVKTTYNFFFLGFGRR